jgi:hypothetical protein
MAAARPRMLALRAPRPVARRDEGGLARPALDLAPSPLPEAEPRTEAVPAVPAWTLLDLVRAVAEATDDEGEVVATVLHLLRSGSVRLAGSFRGGRF